jgi:hypothetical protein
VTIAVFMLLLLPRIIDYSRFHDVSPQDIAVEVAKNHIKMKPLEIETSAMSDIERYFTQLDFYPIRSRQFNASAFQMLGGRYCSIQGITAAQLRYHDPQGRYVTLYETYYDSARFPPLPDVDKGGTPLKLYESGLEIMLWVEKGLLLVSAAPY